MRFFVIAFIFLFSNFMTKMPLPGKICVKIGDTIYIYENSQKTGFKFKPQENKKVKYSGFKWMNTTDMFVGNEYIIDEKTGINQGNVVCFDFSGNIVKRIYESQDGEITGNTYLSKNDKRLLFTTERKGDIKLNPLEGLSRKKSIVVMDFNNKEVIKKIENVGVSPNFELHESPWVYDENRFIYSITGERKIIVEGVNINPIQEQPGIYVYDIATDQTKLLVPGARFAVCSPVDLRIAYIKDQSVWVMGLKDSTTKIVYKGSSKEKISNIHWTPDGKYIYIVYFVNYTHDFFKSGEKLIEVSTSKEVPFKKIGHGFNSYTWK